jgi:uncharacterized peroxidase-related enzyme
MKQETGVISRLRAPQSSDLANEVERLLEDTRGLYGLIPNMARVMAVSPATLRGFLQLVAALTEGKLTAALQAEIALVVAEANRSQYCVSMHTALGAEAGLGEATLASCRLGLGSDPRNTAALQFARAVVDNRGEITDDQLDAVRRAGFDDEEIVEILANVFANIFANYFNNVTQVEIDFPIAGLAIQPPRFP